MLMPCVLPVLVMAGPLEDGTEAFRQSDYPRALIRLQPLADQGNAQAENLIGQMCLYGLGRPKDLPAGLEWERKAAGQGLVEAQNQLGAAYRDGLGVKQDYSEAMKWFLKAANQGDFSAQYSIAELYANGQGVKKDEAEAKKWHDKSVRRPELPGEVVKGVAANPAITLYSLQPWGGPDIPEWDFHGHHVLGHVDLSPEQAKTAVAALKDAVAAGDANTFSMCLINPRHGLRFKTEGGTYDILICYQCLQLEIYQNDLSLPFHGMIGGNADALNGLLKAARITLADSPAALNKSYDEEAKVALKKAEAGDAKAQEVIAQMLMRGRGVKKNEAQGIQWLAKSMALAPDSPEFQIKLGEMYYHGQELTKNEGMAMRLYQKAAAQGSTEALYRMGFLYEYGQGVPKDPAKAIELYRQAAEKGNLEAQVTIGVRYEQGDGVELNYSEALKWLRKAAEQCDEAALWNLGHMYEQGWGVAKDPMEAYFWDTLSVTYGPSGARRVSVTLTPEQLTTVDKRLAEWTAAHAKQAPSSQIR
jgi:uncharacterized protein